MKKLIYIQFKIINIIDKIQRIDVNRLIILEGAIDREIQDRNHALMETSLMLYPKNYKMLEYFRLKHGKKR